MKPKSRRKADQKKAKTVLRLPDLEFAKSAVLDSLTSTDAQRGYAMQLTSSWTGIGRSRAWHSIESLSSATGVTWNPGS